MVLSISYRLSLRGKVVYVSASGGRVYITSSPRMTISSFALYSIVGMFSITDCDLILDFGVNLRFAMSLLLSFLLD